MGFKPNSTLPNQLVRWGLYPSIYYNLAISLVDMRFFIYSLTTRIGHLKCGKRGDPIVGDTIGLTTLVRISSSTILDSGF